ncbi:MAG: aconitase X catalytic domain-containing protein [Elusimicrobia bacterium]|nr:aconitase X catalytic domain-containing protein [Elusimicrobiota bacterium]
MKLRREEKAILDGRQGRGAARAMEILAALGNIHGASDMVAVKSVQVSGVSYRNIGEHGLAFLEEWAGQGSKAVVPAFMNPGGADRKLWKALGLPAEFVSMQRRVIKALMRLGVKPALTCTPYHAAPPPAFGDHLAWAESSAVCYANSVIGSRTNREGGPSAIAAALTGRTPRHSLHTDEGRLPTTVVDVGCPVATTADAGALGYMVGQLLSHDPRGGIPYLRGISPPRDGAREAWLKALGAAMAASGSVGLYHLEGVTPEAVSSGPELKSAAGRRVTVDSLEEGRRKLFSAKGRPNVVAFGCPHASLEELRRLDALLSGRKAAIPIWVFTAEAVRAKARRSGLAERLEACGAVLIADTCIVVAPLAELGIANVATDSAKAAFYLPPHQGVGVYFESQEDAVEAAVTGMLQASHGQAGSRTAPPPGKDDGGPSGTWPPRAKA